MSSYDVIITFVAVFCHRVNFISTETFYTHYASPLWCWVVYAAWIAPVF